MTSKCFPDKRQLRELRRKDFHRQGARAQGLRKDFFITAHRNNCAKCLISSINETTLVVTVQLFTECSPKKNFALTLRPGAFAVKSLCIFRLLPCNTLLFQRTL